MKFLLLLISLFAIAQAISLAETKESLWKQYKLDFKRTFDSKSHEELREKIFRESIRTISHHNFEFRQGRESFKMGINSFSDMTFDEYSAMFKANESIKAMANEKAKNIRFRPKIIHGNDVGNLTERNLAASFDWRDQGAVTKVRDQKLCGSCYAMATIGSIESQYFIMNKKLIDFSEQEIVDCAGEFTTFGCSGGIAFRVFDYVLENQLSTRSGYPYKAEVGECRATENKIKIHLKGYGYVDAEDDDDNLAEAVTKFGPIVVSINSDLETFMRYSSGIYFDEKCTDEVNHGALLVGYGSEDGIDYWIVKNSFGESWGESGYIRMARKMGNDCGIRTSPLFVILKSNL